MHVLTLSRSSSSLRELLVLFGSLLVSLLKIAKFRNQTREKGSGSTARFVTTSSVTFSKLPILPTTWQSKFYPSNRHCVEVQWLPLSLLPLCKLPCIQCLSKVLESHSQVRPGCALDNARLAVLSGRVVYAKAHSRKATSLPPAS